MKLMCKPLQDILTFLKIMGADSATVIPTDDGWEFYARDPSACAMMTGILKAAAFPDGYEAWEPFATELEFLRDNTAKRDDVDIVVEDGYSKITCGKSKCKRRLFTLDGTPRVVPRVQFTNSAAILSDKLIELANNKHMASCGAELGLEFKVEETELTVSYETEIDSYSETYDLLMSNLPEGEQTSHYSPNLLLPVLKGLPKGTPVVMDMDKDKPIKLSVQTELYRFDLFVAPLIGDD